jgi:glycine/D-amino acid oxidase-like deaminating enzyme
MTKEENGKAWEKLPKQDAAAASLLSGSKLPADLDWIDPSLVASYEQMGQRAGATETAQVHPFHYTTAMAELARDKGVDIRLRARVTKINQTRAGGVESVEYEDRDAAGKGGEDSIKKIADVTDVVVAAGPWTGKLLPKTSVSGLRAHSVVYEADVTPYAVFTDIELPGDFVPEHRAKMGQQRKHKGNVDTEIYARPFGEVYACGKISFPFLPPHPLP